MNLIKEVLLFIFCLPSYITRFLKGLRIFSESYSQLLKAWEENERVYKSTDLGKLKDPNKTTEFVKNNRNEALRLLREHEKMFNQLFGIFIATAALIISLVALILK
ncbi:MAG: hypothetical protein UR98_C0001G0004 [Parcubacteria group bacterium GW2011_GWA1_36_12]|nr:MAG: hypothetical protein UR98_C0001G0004 [Parcubacteria group bacterium GW2011_GWA1_36_12]